MPSIPVSIRSLIFIINFAALFSSCFENPPVDRDHIIGKYENKFDHTRLELFKDSTYKAVATDSIFHGHWKFLEPENIAFENWYDRRFGFTKYNIALLRTGEIVFDFDNGDNNFFRLEH